ncbi:nucleoside 2-deoxyribosyltransferase [uncultured Helcococcus sp.]|uniref:nucleoside 2-deoxyribosyltransferase n=1 Tax=uncultured Helcococcus sp. TaxID=1072508 RepID=UPI00288B4DD9|nr:nucleoside 2-deoxyribosyltransferase [uncultured Helcococcus sp.]
MKLYLAGSLFNEAEVAQRKLEGKLLRENFPNLEIFNPIDQPFNENKSSLPTPEDIFVGDMNAVKECDIFFADVSNPLDGGVFMELGLAVELNKKIVAIHSDIRLATANKYEIPTVGMNHYVLGGIYYAGGVVVRNTEEAIKEIAKILENA